MTEVSSDSRQSLNLHDDRHKLRDGHDTTKEHELVSQIRLAEQFLLEKEEDLYFMEETLRRSKKDLTTALSEMSFYQELIGHLQKDALMYLEFVQDIRNAAANCFEERGQRSLRQLVRAHLHKLDLKIEDSVKPHLRPSCSVGSHELLEGVGLTDTCSCMADKMSGVSETSKDKTDEIKSRADPVWSCPKSNCAGKSSIEHSCTPHIIAPQGTL